MTFFSLLYETSASKEKESPNEWLKFKKRSLSKRKKVFEYIGNKLVKVEPGEEKIIYPEFYEHLNLDSIMETIYGQDFFTQKIQKVWTDLSITKETMMYRQDMMRDLEEPACYEAFSTFRNKLKEVHRMMDYSGKVIEASQRDSFYLKAACIYCEAMDGLSRFYAQYKVKSEALMKLKKLLADYIKGEDFTNLKEQAEALKAQFERITYQLIIGEKQVVIRLSEGDVNYTEALASQLGQLDTEETNFVTNMYGVIELNNLETQIMEKLRIQYIDLFRACHQFAHEHTAFIADFVKTIEDELIFYIKFIDYMNGLRRQGFMFCYPKINENKEITIGSMYDLSLANKRQCADEVVFNDIQIEQDEVGACITGANQGGKTTFLRGIGQIVYFTALGLPVAARSARLPLYERIYTHFAESEDQYTNNGKLKEELLKLEDTFATVNDRSLVLTNELFASTTMKDGCELGKRMTIGKS